MTKLRGSLLASVLGISISLVVAQPELCENNEDAEADYGIAGAAGAACVDDGGVCLIMAAGLC